jgi:hypothetical protein
MYGEPSGTMAGAIGPSLYDTLMAAASEPTGEWGNAYGIKGVFTVGGLHPKRFPVTLVVA